MMTHKCRKCGDELTDENWFPSRRKKGDYICKRCHSKQSRLWDKENPERAKELRVNWRKENPEKDKAIWTRSNRKHGNLPMDENKNCPSYLGVHIAERLIRNRYGDDIEVMPYGNPGYDFICNKGKLVDAKSACLNKYDGWLFHIGRNTIADFFICTAFDNREDLNVLHVWMIPGDVVNHLVSASICQNTVHKWDEYELDIDKISSCCNEMKDAARGDE